MAIDRLRSNWVRFIYREFHDVPREIIVSGNGGFLLLSCPFSDALDDYPSTYELYWIEGLADLAGPWEHLSEAATERLGSVPVDRVVLDATKRATLDLSSLGASVVALADRFSS